VDFKGGLYPLDKTHLKALKVRPGSHRGSSVASLWWRNDAHEGAT